MPKPLYFVYILLCSDGTYYVGQTDDTDARLSIHQSGKGPKYTANRLPVSLLQQGSFEQRADAMAREKQVKRWSGAKKEALINRDPTSLHKLAKRHVF